MTDRRPIIAIAALLALTAVFVGLRSYWHVPNSDDTVYGYVLETDTWGGYWTVPGTLKTPLTRYGQIIPSQINHYQYANGRAPIHALEQAYTALWGTAAFAISNAAIFICAIFCLVFLAVPRPGRWQPIYWLIAIMALLYLMPLPARLWFSMNLALNYLWPTALMLLVLLMWRLTTLSAPSLNFMCLAAIAGFILGWSHEAFSLPVAGMLLIYYICHFDEFKHRGWPLAVSVWFGALLLLIAPGNWGRLGHDLEMPEFSLANMAVVIGISLFKSPIFWIAVITWASFWFCDRGAIKSSWQQCKWLAFVAALALVFVALTRRGEYALTPFLILLLVMTLNLLSCVKISWSWLRIVHIATCLLAAFYVVSQIVIVADSREYSLYIDDVMHRYEKSAEGICLYDPPRPHWLSNEYVDHFPALLLQKHNLFNMAAPHLAKPITLLYPDEYSLIKGRGYDKAPRCHGNTPFREVGRWYWAPAEKVPDGSQFYLNYQPVDFSHDVPLPIKVKMAFWPHAYPDREIAQVDTFVAHNCTWLRISPHPVRKLHSITSK